VRIRAAGFGTGLIGVIGAIAVLGAGTWFTTAQASSHREAPLITADPYADNTDVYAFVSLQNPDRVTLISNFIPLEAPQAGPNYYKFDDNVLYEIMIDNDGDAVEDITYQFRFRTETRFGNTFLYNVGPVTSIDDPDLNVRQFYSITRVDGERRRGRSTLIADNLPVAPANVGPRSFPNYAAVAAGALRQLPNNSQVFVGPRDEGFYVDVGGVFDLLGVADGTAVDGLAGLNVHSIALQVPIESVTSTGSRPATTGSAGAVIGVWSTASRSSVASRGNGNANSNSIKDKDLVQVSRLGQPLVNELVIPRSTKDTFNSLEPKQDAAALPFVLDPEPARLLNIVFGINVPPTPRNDLVTIFLTGIPTLNQPQNVTPSEMLRLNVAIPPSAVPNPIGFIGGDPAGFPNGRRVGDDVVDIALRVMAGATALTGAFNVAPNNTLGDGVSANDVPYLTEFPYLALPHAGNQ
jgi:hypothetical protein